MNPAIPLVAVFADESCLGNGRDGANPGGAGGLIEYVSPAEKVTRLDYWISEPGTTNNRMALRSAIEALARLSETRLVGFSAFYQSDSLLPGQPRYTNAVAALDSSLAPLDLLDALQAIETGQGRERLERWGPRTLDLDIILYGGSRVDEHGLHIPHPRAHERAFVLAPLAEVWPDARLGRHGSARELLSKVAGDGAAT